MMVKCVSVDIFRHEAPINAAHKLPPAYHLANEPFGSVNRHFAVRIGPFDLPANLQRIKQADIQIKPDNRMKHERRIALHRVLIIAELRQALGNEISYRLFRISGRDGKPKGGQIAKMIGKPCVNQRQNIGCDLVGLKPCRCWCLQAATRRFAVIMVKIPLTARRCLIVHQ